MSRWHFQHTEGTVATDGALAWGGGPSNRTLPVSSSPRELSKFGAPRRTSRWGADHRRFEAFSLLYLQPEHRKVAPGFKTGNVVPDQPGAANAGVPVTLLAILKGGQRNAGELGLQRHCPARMPDQHVGNPGSISPHAPPW